MKEIVRWNYRKGCAMLPDLAQRQRQIQRAFLQVLSGGGYLEVKTPGFELYELLRRGFIAEETMYKFTDHRGVFWPCGRILLCLYCAWP